MTFFKTPRFFFLSNPGPTQGHLPFEIPMERPGASFFSGSTAYGLPPLAIQHGQIIAEKMGFTVAPWRRQ